MVPLRQSFAQSSLPQRPTGSDTKGGSGGTGGKYQFPIGAVGFRLTGSLPIYR
jgi:hypothetical protein